MTSSVRISNNYLFAIISLLIKLGVNEVSIKVMVEAWTSAGYECNDVFFMHLDTLVEYGFVKYNLKTIAPASFDQLLAGLDDNDEFASVTRQGIEFLNKYGC